MIGFAFWNQTIIKVLGINSGIREFLYMLYQTMLILLMMNLVSIILLLTYKMRKSFQFFS